METNESRTPTSDELYAYELLARRERARAQSQLLLAGARWIAGTLKSIFTRGPSAVRVRRQVVHHSYE